MLILLHKFTVFFEFQSKISTNKCGTLFNSESAKNRVVFKKVDDGY